MKFLAPHLAMCLHIRTQAMNRLVSNVIIFMESSWESNGNALNMHVDGYYWRKVVSLKVFVMPPIFGRHWLTLNVWLTVVISHWFNIQMVRQHVLKSTHFSFTNDVTNSLLVTLQWFVLWARIRFKSPNKIINFIIGMKDTLEKFHWLKKMGYSISKMKIQSTVGCKFKMNINWQHSIKSI